MGKDFNLSEYLTEGWFFKNDKKPKLTDEETIKKLLQGGEYTHSAYLSDDTEVYICPKFYEGWQVYSVDETSEGHYKTYVWWQSEDPMEDIDIDRVAGWIYDRIKNNDPVDSYTQVARGYENLDDEEQ